MAQRDRADYMKEYRAKQKPGTRNAEMAALREEITVKPEDRVSPKRTDPETGEIPSQTAGYACGCGPEGLCMSHGIAKMSQVDRDKILASPEINKPGRKGGKE